MEWRTDYSLLPCWLCCWRQHCKASGPVTVLGLSFCHRARYGSIRCTSSTDYAASEAQLIMFECHPKCLSSAHSLEWSPHSISHWLWLTAKQCLQSLGKHWATLISPFWAVFQMLPEYLCLQFCVCALTKRPKQCCSCSCRRYGNGNKAYITRWWWTSCKNRMKKMFVSLGCTECTVFAMETYSLPFGISSVSLLFSFQLLCFSHHWFCIKF